MGVIDAEGKQYLSNPVFFADAFNTNSRNSGFEFLI
jgi:hypothetical protein